MAVVRLWARPGRLLSDHLRKVAEGSARLRWGRGTAIWRASCTISGRRTGMAGLPCSISCRRCGRGRRRGPGHASAGAEWLRVHGGKRPTAMHSRCWRITRASSTKARSTGPSINGSQRASGGSAAADQAILSEAILLLGSSTPPPTGRSGEMFTRMLFALVDADREDAAGESQHLRSRFRRRTCFATGSATATTTRSRRPPATPEPRWGAAASHPRLLHAYRTDRRREDICGVLWALRHAEIHGLRRVVVALPYTSIIEQNAEALRRAGLDVLEHHHAVAEEKRGQHAETWAAPLIITTTVQFFSSFLSPVPARFERSTTFNRAW